MRITPTIIMLVLAMGWGFNAPNIFAAMVGGGLIGLVCVLLGDLWDLP